MAIEEQEAKTLAEAIQRVEKHYPGMSAVMRGKVMDHVALVGAVGSVYGTRLAAIGIRIKREKDEAKKPPASNAPGTVVQFQQ